MIMKGERMKPLQKAIKALRDAGYTNLIHGAKHDRYKNPLTGRCISLKRHDFDEDDLEYILKEIRQNTNKQQGER